MQIDPFDRASPELLSIRARDRQNNVDMREWSLYDFNVMELHHEASWDDITNSSRYSLQRLTSGEWQVKLKRQGVSSATHKESVAPDPEDLGVAEALKWQPVPSEHQGVLGARYELYLRSMSSHVG